MYYFPRAQIYEESTFSLFLYRNYKGITAFFSIKNINIFCIFCKQVFVILVYYYYILTETNLRQICFFLPINFKSVHSFIKSFYFYGQYDYCFPKYYKIE